MHFPNKSRLSHISLRSQRCKPTRHWRPSLPWEPSGRHQFLHLNWVFHTFWDSIFPASLVAWALASNSKFLPSFPLVIILLGPNGGLLYKWSPLTSRLPCQLQIFSEQGTCFSSVQFRHSVMSNSLWPHGLQHARPPSSHAVIPFSSHLQQAPS